MQSLGLLYLVEVYWTPVIDYILASMTFLMVFTKISYPAKYDSNPNEYPDVVRGRFFMGQLDLPGNMQAVGITTAIIVTLMLLLVVFKAIRKKFTI